MSVDQPRTRTAPDSVPTTAPDPARLAAAARSVLACPAEVHLVVDGIDDVLADADDLGMQDLGGEPTFSCPTDSALAVAGRQRRSALLTLESGLGATGSSERTARLTLTGRLESRGTTECPCCTERREVVVLVLNVALLGRADGHGRRAPQLRVPLDHFSSPQHDLNRGFLQRSAEHANACHQQELRQSVSTASGTRLAEVVGVTLSGLDRDGVDLFWVDPDGAHHTHLDFGRSARDAEDLGELLRSTLHAGLC